MTRQERMISSHCECLSGIYKENIHKMKFNTYTLNTEIDKDTVISDSKLKKIAVITRHHLDFTCSATHALILEGEHYDRL
jgi:hypothetical protein